MSGQNLAKIRKALPDIELTDDLKGVAERLDKKEALEKLVKSEDGLAFKSHFAEEIARAITEILREKDDFTPVVEKLRALIGFYKMFANAENDAEMMRNMVDEIIDETLVS
ncbi:hypothetical protein N8148_02785 [Gammaproteobacteria bacterium]|nr:hypothetical protein [Gammaproteobacteria bacterium]